MFTEFFLSTWLLAASLQSGMTEYDFTKGKMPDGVKPLISKRVENKLKQKPFVKDGKSFALFCGGSGQYGLFAATAVNPLKKQGPFTMLCTFSPRTGYMTALLYYREGWNSPRGFSLLQNGARLCLKVGKEYIIMSDRENPLQRGVHYIAAVIWDGKAWQMVLNGRGFTAQKNPPFLYPAKSLLHIGGYNTATNNIFQGTIRSVKVFDRALTSEELRREFRAVLRELQQNTVCE